MVNQPEVCIVGLGYVGLTLAVSLAETGIRVVGVERNPTVVDDLRAGRTHIHEVGLQPLLGRVVANGALRVETDMAAADACTVFIISVGTPIDDTGRINLAALTEAATAVGRVMPPDSLVILRSTVKVGVTAGLVNDLSFCPERTLEGQALEELRRLPQILSGLTASAVARSTALFAKLTPAIVHVSTVEVAEAIKLIDNTSRDISFAVANEVARFCDLVGIDAIEVIRRGAQGYPRTSLPLPGPVGGPCLSKDPLIYAQSFEATGMIPKLAAIARDVNRQIPLHAMESARDWMRRSGAILNRPRIALLGMAFKGKPETDDLRGTTTLDVRDAAATVFENPTFVAWDPVVRPQAIEAVGVAAVDDLGDAIQGADLVVIANNHPIWSSIDLTVLSQRMNRPGLIYDLWNNFDAKSVSLPDTVGFQSLGRHGVSSGGRDSL
jgi:UDP-N-acetyl-D-mannosaminuronic acid dehydrogenase